MFDNSFSLRDCILLRNYILFFMLFAVVSCKDRIEPLPVSIIRFDKLLPERENYKSVRILDSLVKPHSDFWDLYTQDMIRIGSSEDSVFYENLSYFMEHPVVKGSFNRAGAVFAGLEKEESILGEAFAWYKNYFPSAHIPQVYSCVTGFNQSITTSGNLLVIGLDKYLGENEDYYAQLGIPLYQSRIMSREYIPTDAVRAMGYAEFSKNDSLFNLASEMIYEGRNYYFASRILPSVPDTILFGFTKKQMEWCKASRAEMWRFLVEQKMLFSNERMFIVKLINPSPYTAYFSEDSPGRAAVWLGYEIVKAYMKANHDKPLNELMNEPDYRNILNGSRFRP